MKVKLGNGSPLPFALFGLEHVSPEGQGEPPAGVQIPELRVMVCRPCSPSMVCLWVPTGQWKQ